MYDHHATNEVCVLQPTECPLDSRKETYITANVETSEFISCCLTESCWHEQDIPYLAPSVENTPII